MQGNFRLKLQNRSFSLSRNKKNKLKTIQWKKLRNWDVIEDKKISNSPSLRPVRVPKLQIFVKMFRRNLQSPVWKHHGGTPIWWPENSVNIWNLLWISRRLIISTAKTNIYRRTFPNALTSKRAQNQEISIYFSTNSIVALCHAPP